MTACARQVVLALLSTVLRRAGRTFLAGRGSALAVAQRLAALGFFVILAYWNDPADPADHAAAVEVELTALAVLPGRPRIGVKAPVLDFESAAVKRLAHAARRAGLGLVLDSHAPADADATLAPRLQGPGHGCRGRGGPARTLGMQRRRRRGSGRGGPLGARDQGVVGRHPLAGSLR